MPQCVQTVGAPPATVLVNIEANAAAIDCSVLSFRADARFYLVTWESAFPNAITLENVLADMFLVLRIGAIRLIDLGVF